MTRDRLVPLILAAAVVSACESREEGTAPAPTKSGTPRQSSPLAGACESVPGGPVSGTAVIEPGPSNGLPRSPARGEPLVIDGAVLDNECEPAANATLRLWHTDARGAYGPGENECCYYAGTGRADGAGRVRVRTVKPGRYAETNAPPAHIHLEVRHPAGGLNTEIVFAGEAGVPTVPVDGYAPVDLQRRGGDRPSWSGEVTLVLRADYLGLNLISPTSGQIAGSGPLPEVERRYRKAAPTWAARVVATSRAGFAGRLPGAAVSRNRP